MVSGKKKKRFCLKILCWNNLFLNLFQILMKLRFHLDQIFLSWALKWTKGKYTSFVLGHDLLFVGDFQCVCWDMFSAATYSVCSGQSYCWADIIQLLVWCYMSPENHYHGCTPRSVTRLFIRHTPALYKSTRVEIAQRLFQFDDCIRTINLTPDGECHLIQFRLY